MSYRPKRCHMQNCGDGKRREIYVDLKTEDQTLLLFFFFFLSDKRS